MLTAALSMLAAILLLLLALLTAPTGALAAPPGALAASVGSATPGNATPGNATPGNVKPGSETPASAKPRSRSCAYANLSPTATDTPSVDAATLCLIDRVRAGDHLRPLRSNDELESVATTEVSDMVSGNYFADDTPSGETPGALIATTPYGARTASLTTAQDLGWGTLSDASAVNMVAAWMRSPPHREIILTAAFREAGVGVTSAVPSVLGGGTPGATYAVEFATRD
ncbi:MAG TPA: CAP domain-containing protein [Solirubrobacteraceae bacterium]|nr:CAP domain-containing protein [Solirubrobacteraceae bacterium]